jgi:phosphotransferase system IIA component
MIDTTALDGKVFTLKWNGNDNVVNTSGYIFIDPSCPNPISDV